MVISMLRRVNIQALKAAASNLSVELPDEDMESYLKSESSATGKDSEKEISEETLRKYHHLLFEIHILDGSLVCPESSRKFPIKDGIPNMLLHEDEI